MDFFTNHIFKDIRKVDLLISVIKSIEDSYRFYGLIIAKTTKQFTNVKLWTLKCHF